MALIFPSQPLSLFAATASICFLAGFIPTIGTELALTSIGVMIKPSLIVPLALLGAFSQTLSKVSIYFLSARMLFLLSYRRKRKLIRLRRRFRNRQKLTTGVIFVSSLTGLPPYYLINIICGLLDTGWLSFAVLGFAGMFIRFSLCLSFPQLIMQLFQWLPF